MLRRRTSIATSTSRIPTNAVIEDAWPLGKDLLSSSPTLSCQPGRSRPSVSLIVVVSREVTIMTTTAYAAARRWPLASSAIARITVSAVIPMVPKACSMTRSTDAKSGG